MNMNYERRRPQFDANQRRRAMELIEELPWGDVSYALYGLEHSLALALEATGDAIYHWEAEGEGLFGDEFRLSAQQVAGLDDAWRLAYIARHLFNLAISYGVRPWIAASPGRSPDGEVTSPIGWGDEYQLARLLRGLNDILWYG